MRKNYLLLICSVLLSLLTACSSTKNDSVVNLDEAKIVSGEKRVEISSLKKVLDYDERTLPENMDSVIFGKYEQDNNANNGKEDIEWNILSREGNNLFLISKYVLEKKPFQNDKVMNNWYDCSLRSWLNTSFYNTAFDDTEKGAIVRRTYENDSLTASNEIRFHYNNTDDLVSIISYDEIKKYMGKPGEDYEDQFHNRRLCTKPTEYAKNVSDQYGITLTVEKSIGFCKGCTIYWIRDLYDTGSGEYCSACCAVYPDGTVLYEELDSDYAGVRPIIYIDLSKLDDNKISNMTSHIKVSTQETNDRVNQVNSNANTSETKAKADNSWEMKFFEKVIDAFKEDIKSEISTRNNSNNQLITYVQNSDGSVTFNYGLRDIDKDNVKEMIIYNNGKLFSILKLLNDYYEDAPEYKDMFYPANVFDIRTWFHTDDVVSYDAKLYSDNYIVIDRTHESYGSIDRYYDDCYIKGDGYELAHWFYISSDSEDGLGEFTDFINEDASDIRMTEQEGINKIHSHGNPVVVNEGMIIVN